MALFSITKPLQIYWPRRQNVSFHLSAIWQHYLLPFVRAQHCQSGRQMAWLWFLGDNFGPQSGYLSVCPSRLTLWIVNQNHQGIRTLGHRDIAEKAKKHKLPESVPETETETEPEHLRRSHKTQNGHKFKNLNGFGNTAPTTPVE